jgi:hypothetical protein
MAMSDTLTSEEYGAYIKIAGRRGQQARETLSKHVAFVQAVQTEVGRELLKDLVNSYEDLLNKLASLQASDEEKMEYKAVRKLLLRWADRIIAYERSLEDVKKTISAGL